MDNNVKIDYIVLDNVKLIYDHTLISLRRAVKKVNNGEATIELENNGTEINMFIKDKQDVDETL